MNRIVYHVGGEDVYFRIPFLMMLRERGYDVGAIGSGDSGPFTKSGIRYHRFNLARHASPVGDLRSILALRHIVRNELRLPAVIHTFDTKPGYLVPLAVRSIQNVKLIRTVTGRGNLFSSKTVSSRCLSRVYCHLYKGTSGIVTHTVFQNSGDMEFFLKRGMVREGGCSLVRGSGVDVSQYDARSLSADERVRIRSKHGIGDEPVIILVSRLIRSKGIMEYVEAARLLRKRFPSVQFLLVGPAHPLSGEAISPDEVGSNSECIRYMGERSDVRELLSISDIMVLPSYYSEGLPRVLLEGASMSLPLITTDMPGCRDIVRDGWNGYLVPPRDHAALASALERLLSEPAMRVSMGNRSREYAEAEFSLDAVVDQYDRLYEKLLSNQLTISGQTP